MADARLKSIKIKTGVVKRLAKETQCYQKEAQTESDKVDAMAANKATDEYVLKKQREVLQETRSMIPDCQRRLAVAKDELQHTLDAEKDLAESQEYKDAKELLASVQ